MSYSYFFPFTNKKHKDSKKSWFLILIVILCGCSASAQKGLHAEYYDGTDFNKLVATKIVSEIDNSWNDYPPVPGIDPHSCSIRWTGKLKPGHDGTYKFAARVDDGIRVWIDDQLIIDQWELNDVGIFKGKVKMEGNREYDLKVEYFNALIEGEVRLLWSIPDPDPSWYSRWLSDDYVVIDAEYFVQPDAELVEPEVEQIVASIDNDVIPVAPPKKAPRSTKKKVIKKKAPKKDLSTTKKKEKVAPAIAERPIAIKTIEDYIPKKVAFEHAKTNILKESFQELNVFAKYMMEHPEVTIRIEGHTDPVGNAEQNQVLSERRAFAVARYLVVQGVNGKRIDAKGLGGTQPLVVPEDGKYHPANRRVEFIVTSTSK